MDKKSLAVLVSAGMFALVLSTVDRQRPAEVVKASNSTGTIESASWKLFLRDRPLPESCINVHQDSDVSRVGQA